MRIENYFDLSGAPGFSGLHFVSGSFGIIDGAKDYTRFERDGVTFFEYTHSDVTVKAEFSVDKNGVVYRRDTVKNISDREIELNSFASRFALDGNEYEIYTQYSGWQHENCGGWQKLVTEIRAATAGLRTCDGAAPIMGFHNLYTEKNTVFHLIPNAMWQMSAKKIPDSLREVVVFECGFCDRGLHMKVMPGEEIELPCVVFFNAECKRDLDAYKLHEWYNEKYPRRSTPVLYNSWMYCFDRLNVDSLLLQADAAAELGIEAFMIDAGWFGNGDGWFSSVGDWDENMTGGPSGRLIEISERVRRNGMIFGLWFEPERADARSKAVSEHPDYYFSGGFLDFANPDAVEYMLGVISERIEKYGIGCLKFDLNASIPNDPSGNGFYRYMKGQREFIMRLRKKYPDLYISGCAGGGYRMELSQGMLFDSFWPSDNQGPLGGLRIIKDTLKRMPTSMIERWCVQKFCEGFPAYPNEPVGRMVHCGDATWDSLVGINDSFSEGFMLGGPMGFSCDLTGFDNKHKESWRGIISQHKKEREFYRGATARILVDSDSITVIEYSDVSFDKCIIQIFTKTVHTGKIIVYPTVDACASYTCDGAVLCGNDIKENGIAISNLTQNSSKAITLLKI